MYTWEFLTYFRFEAFPFVPEEEKRRPIRQLLEMDVHHPVFQTTLKPYVDQNRFADFCKGLRELRKRKWMLMPFVMLDKELFETLFWNESDPRLACRIAAVFLQFPTISFPKEWTMGTNLLLRSSCEEDTQCALLFLESYFELW